MCADRQSVFKCVICKSILIDVLWKLYRVKTHVTCHDPLFSSSFFAEIGISEITVVMNAALHGDVIVTDVHKSGKTFKGPLTESQLPLIISQLSSELTCLYISTKLNVSIANVKSRRKIQRFFLF